jgi:phage terminase large subunit
MSRIVLPNQWNARPHQAPFMTALASGVKRAVCVWHRRAGKDSASLNFEAVEAHRTIANYWHMLPTAVQGRHVVWDAIDPRTGVRVIDQVFPPEIRTATNQTEMKIELACGSTWQVVGSDNYDRLVGSNPFGVVFSEYSIADPRAWDFIRPILAENGGWAIFIYTPRGKNHGYDLYQMAEKNPEWFCEMLTIDHTQRNDGSPVITRAQYQEEIDAGMDPQLAMQEFYCSFDAGLMGAYYTDQLKQAKYGSYPWNPKKVVHTFWDIGMKDATAIWFGQENGGAVDVIDYRCKNNVSFGNWIKELRELPYTYGVNSMPHDFKKRDWKDGSSAISVADEFSFEVEITPDITRQQGIDAAKQFLPRCRFNTDNPDVQSGIDALYNYRREYNDKLRVFMNRPLHDWAADGADAFRYMAIAWPEHYRARGSMSHKVIGASQTTRSRVTKMPKIKSQDYTDMWYGD